MKTLVYMDNQSFELNYDEYVICPLCGERVYGGIHEIYYRCPTCCGEWSNT